jgi:glycosyltransferase involved in cell wall biosynthesis
VDLLKGYDAVVAHSFCGGLFALEAHKRFGVPYFVTWHGSDVHTHPWRVPVILEDTRSVMESARCNFFVSRALMAASDKISMSARKEVLYNGVSEDFVRYLAEQRAAVRERYGLAPEDKVVAFVGNLVTVKNVMALPEIFSQVARRFAESSGSEVGGSLKFWIVGDGKLRAQLESAFSLSFRPNDPSLSFRPNEVSGEISFFGNQPSPVMPDIMNCIDVLVLPSLNEGLPLVCAEALSCGAAVVGSDVGGIAEVIGSENVVPLGDSFVNGMAEKVVAALMGQSPSQTLPSDISWARTAAQELAALKSL